MVELLVVIAIIGVLATLLLLQLGVARQRARDVRRIADVNQLRTASELYYDDNGGYPEAATYDQALQPLFVPKYLVNWPQDPLNSTPFKYHYAYNGSPSRHYQVWAELEGWTQALASDADINSANGSLAGWQGDLIDGAKDDKTTSSGPNSKGDCSTAATSAVEVCVYDQGQP